MIEVIAFAIREHNKSISEDEALAMARRIFKELCASGHAWEEDK